MSFISGLKSLFKKPIYAVIILLFVAAWFLLLIAYAYIPSIGYRFFILQFIGVLGFFTLLLLIVSFIRPIDKLGYVIVLILFLISLTIIFVFENIMSNPIFRSIFLISNQILTAFFAFKLCIDSSTKIDDYLYNKKKSRKITRTIEFVGFGILTWLVFRTTWKVFTTLPAPINIASANIFRIMLWVDLILIAFVIIRLLFVQKLAAFIPLFFIFTFLYILFIIIDTIAEINPITPSYAWFSFLIDLFLFFFIIGSIFDKVDYLKNKLKIFRADTISLFVIIMKLYAQLTKIIPITAEAFINLQLWLLGIFLICTLLFGLYAIFFHKEGKKSK